jgi:hypothetical protein
MLLSERTASKVSLEIRFTKTSGASSAAKTAVEVKEKPKAQTTGHKKVKNLRFIK